MYYKFRAPRPAHQQLSFWSNSLSWILHRSPFLKLFATAKLRQSGGFSCAPQGVIFNPMLRMTGWCMSHKTDCSYLWPEHCSWYWQICYQMLVVVSLQFNFSKKKTVCAKKDSVFLRLSHPKSEDQDHQDMWCPGSSCNLAKVFEPTTHKGNSIRAKWGHIRAADTNSAHMPSGMEEVIDSVLQLSALKIVLTKVKAGAAWSFKRVFASLRWPPAQWHLFKASKLYTVTIFANLSYLDVFSPAEGAKAICYRDRCPRCLCF